MMPYILHAGLILAGCLVFYKLLLQKETFYRLNRFILLGCLVVSFVLPLLPVPRQWSFRTTESVTSGHSPELSLYSAIAVPDESQKPAASTNSNDGIKSTVTQRALQGVIMLYWFGVAAFGINFLLQLVSLYYRAYSSPVIRDGKFRIVELSGNKAPCSFGNNIFINPARYDWETYNQILLHEKIHIEQGHTLDIVLAEIILIFQWFNPFAWLYRREMESNLEFLTDDQVLHDPQVEKASYQMSLLKVSAPQFPLNLTTNYNQSLLKKRLVMMNAKRSNVHTTWKYFFILPLLVLFVCLFNEPTAIAQSKTASKQNDNENIRHGGGMETEGAWFATIKDDKVHIQFKNDEDDNSLNSATFLLSELKGFSRDASGKFSIGREAGTMEFTGRFEGNSGMGRYKFTSDKTFADFLRSEGVHDNSEKDMMAYFIIDVTKSYVQTLKQHGYTGLGKNELLPLAALKIDGPYIESLKSSGFSGLAVHELISLKALGVDTDYIAEIRKAGYKNISANQLVSFKAQNINGNFITEMRNAAKKEGKPDPVDSESPEEIVAYKAMSIDPAYVKSLSDVGLKGLSNSELVAMKANGITAEYVKNLQADGYKTISASDLIAIKAQNITLDFIKSFAVVGWNNLSFKDAMPVKAMGITPEFVQGFRDIGFQNVSIDNTVALKAQNITPALINEYKALGYPDLSLHDVTAAKATGVTPAFIASMKEKGHNFKSIQKYIQLKNAIE